MCAEGLTGVGGGAYGGVDCLVPLFSLPARLRGSWYLNRDLGLCEQKASQAASELSCLRVGGSRATLLQCFTPLYSNASLHSASMQRSTSLQCFEVRQNRQFFFAGVLWTLLFKILPLSAWHSMLFSCVLWTLRFNILQISFNRCLMDPASDK